MSCTPLALGRSAPCSQQNSGNPECLLRLAAPPPSTILNNSHYLRVHNGHVLNWTKLDFTLIAVASIFLHLLFAFNLGCVEFWHGVVFNFYGVESIDLHVISSIDFELKKKRRTGFKEILCDWAETFRHLALLIERRTIWGWGEELRWYPFSETHSSFPVLPRKEWDLGQRHRSHFVSQLLWFPSVCESNHLQAKQFHLSLGPKGQFLC